MGHRSAQRSADRKNPALRLRKLAMLSGKLVPLVGISDILRAAWSSIAAIDGRGQTAETGHWPVRDQTCGGDPMQTFWRNAEQLLCACPPGDREIHRHVPDNAVHKDVASNAADFSQDGFAIEPGTHVRVGCIQRNRLVCVENQRPSGRIVLHSIERSSALQGSQASHGIQSEGNALFRGRGLAGGRSSSLVAS
jgi:hypothetical protein